MKDIYLMYLRKSRADSPNETVEEVLAKHERILQNFAINILGHRIDEEYIYREVVSGETIEDRPQIKALFEIVETKNVKGVFVVEPQRLSRGDLIDCGTVMRYFKYTNTLIYTPTKIFDLNDEFDSKFFQGELMRGREYFEYSLRIMQRGRKQSVLEGNFIYNNIPLGYDKVFDRKNKKQYLVPNNDAVYVKKIFEMYASGSGATKICQFLDSSGLKPKKASHWYPGTVYNILKNDTYIGNITFGESTTIRVIDNGVLKKKIVKSNKPIVVENCHEPIISKELFEKVQNLRGSHSKAPIKKKSRNFLIGLLRCKKCGSHVAATYSRGKMRFICANKNLNYCDSISTDADTLIEQLIHDLKQYLDNFDVSYQNDLSNQKQDHEKMIANLEKKLSDLEQKQQKLYDFLESGIYTKEVFLNRNEKLDDERKSLTETLEKEKALQIKSDSAEIVKGSLHQAIEMLSDDTIDAFTKNKFLKSFIKEIRYEKKSFDFRKKGKSNLGKIDLDIIFK